MDLSNHSDYNEDVIEAEFTETPEDAAATRELVEKEADPVEPSPSEVRRAIAHKWNIPDDALDLMGGKLWDAFQMAYDNGDVKQCNEIAKTIIAMNNSNINKDKAVLPNLGFGQLHLHQHNESAGEKKEFLEDMRSNTLEDEV